VVEGSWFDGTDGMGASPSVPSDPSDQWSLEGLGPTFNWARCDAKSEVVNDGSTPRGAGVRLRRTGGSWSEPATATGR